MQRLGLACERRLPGITNALHDTRLSGLRLWWKFHAAQPHGPRGSGAAHEVTSRPDIGYEHKDETMSVSPTTLEDQKEEKDMYTQ